MNALVVYDSLYGNTKAIAEAIGEVMATVGPARVVAVADVPALPPGVDLLIVGGPTHGHTISEGIKRFLDALAPHGIDGIDVAAFDTRVDWPVVFSGAASRGIAKQLKQKGGHLVGTPGSFLVDGREGPLRDGERERASIWAQQIVESLHVQAA